LLAIIWNPWKIFKSHFQSPLPHEPVTHNPIHARAGRDPRIMAPVIIMGAIMMLVFWDTSDVK
jgi:hypothetical protein